MQYELKSKGRRHPLKLALSVIILIVGLGALAFSFNSGDIMKMIISIVYVGLGIWGFVIQLNTVIKSLQFNNVSFTFKDRTFTYQQIEKVVIHGGRYGEVYYRIFVGGEVIYTFEGTYEGAKEFLFYLDFYKVPIEHYKMGAR